MLPRVRRQGKPVSVGLVSLLLCFPVQSQCAISSSVRGYGGGHARSTGFIASSGVGGGCVQHAAEAAPTTSAWSSAWQWLPQRRKDSSYPRTSSRAIYGSKKTLFIRYSSSSASRDEDGGIDPSVVSSNQSGVEVTAKPRPMPSGRAAAEGRGDNGGGRGGGNDSGAGVHSLVDLVKLLHVSDNPVWELVRFEGREASEQSHVSTMIQGSVLDRTSLEDAVSCDIASKIATTFLSPTEVRCLMGDMYADEPLLDFIVAEDLLAHAMQDTSLPDVLTAMLFHKGFTALTTYRLMHWLWTRDRQNLARYLQSICSEVCAADIHPAARIGRGILMASGCDIVIGETAVVGDGVCLLQGVTLGGTGNQTGDRHPKVGEGCHIGAGSSILGNIPLGEGSRIEAASVVVKPTKPYTINRGVPSQTVGWIVCDPYQDVGARIVTEVDEAGEREGGAAEAVKPRRVFSNYGSLYIGV